MNRFRFRFASVLRYREIMEETRKRGFGAAMDHYRHEESRLKRIDGEIAGLEESMERGGQGRISVQDLQNRYNYARVLDRKREAQEKTVKAAEQEVERRRRELVEAMKQKKIFERLRERDRETYENELRKEEQKMLDEFSVQRFNRTSGK